MGVIHYYCNMCPRWSNVLFPLTKLTSIKNKFKLMQVKQDAFKNIKWIVARNTLLTYLDFNETFKIHTNDSKFRLGAVT